MSCPVQVIAKLVYIVKLSTKIVFCKENIELLLKLPKTVFFSIKLEVVY